MRRAAEDGEWFYALARLLVTPIVRALAPGSACYGAERVPATGGAVLALNHLAAIDPPLVGAFCARPLRCMAKAELLATPLVGRIIGSTGAFPVRRGAGDREALQRARLLVSNGQLLGVFAEGTRQRFGYPGRVQAGAAMIAMHEQVPLIPVGLETFGWRLGNRRRCAVVFGGPVDLSDLPCTSGGYREASTRIEDEIRRLWRQAAQALATGLPSRLADGVHRSGFVSFAPPIRRARYCG